MIVLTENIKKDFERFRKILDSLKMKEEEYHYMTETGKTVLEQIANGMEITAQNIKHQLPVFGSQIESEVKEFISKLDYKYRLLADYCDPELDDTKKFASDQEDILLALRNDVFKRKD